MRPFDSDMIELLLFSNDFDVKFVIFINNVSKTTWS